MKNNMKVLFAVALAALLTTSCIDETEPMGGTVTSGQVGESPSGLSGLVASMNAQMTAFNTLGNDAHYDFGYPGFLLAWDMLGNDMATADPYYTWHSTWEENVSLNYEYASSRWFWTWYYKQIFITNMVLGAADPESPEAGIARTYRAMCYLDMARLYEFKKNNYTTSEYDLEGLTVPIVTDTTSMAMISNNPRADIAKIYEFIESDLLEAERLLEGFQRPAKNTPDQSVARGLLARMYLEKGSRFNDTDAFTKAAEYARKVINSGYAPLTEAQWFDKQTGFNSSTANDAWIWSVNITSEDRVVTSGIVNFTSWMAPEQSFGYSNAIGKGSPQKCIDKKFYESIPDTDWRKKSWIAPDYSNGNLCIAGAAFAQAYLNPYCGIKFRPGQGEMSDYMVAAAVDVPLMRVEEMYLIEAEATGLAGGDGKSLLESFVKTHRDPSFAYSEMEGISGNVLKQKRIEFWGEGITIFDMKRLNASINRGYEGTNHYDATRFNTNGLAPWYNFCINIREMQSNAAFNNDPGMCNPDPSNTVPLWE